MDLFKTSPGHPCADPPAGIWRTLLRSRFLGRAEPLFIDARGLRSAASLWSGAQMWAQLLRTHPECTSVRVTGAERLSLLQLLIAVLWDGRTLSLDAAGPASPPGTWCLDGRQVWHGDRPVCRLGEGGWPELSSTSGLTPVDMLRFAPSQGEIAVRGLQASHGHLWLSAGAALARPAGQSVAADAPATDPELLAPFDLCGLSTPRAVLEDALLPLLRSQEVQDPGAEPPHRGP